jgi:VWFA-related protein
MTYVTPLFMRWLRVRTAVPALLVLMLSASPAVPQTQSTTPSPSQSNGQTTTPQTQKPQVPEAGGPEGDTGPIAVPKKKPAEEPPPEKQPKIKNPEGLEDFSLRVNVPLVTLDVSVLTKDGQFIPGLKGGNFKVYEDGVEQKLVNFNQTTAPITAVLLVEFANTNYAFIIDMLNGAYSFLGVLKPEDWTAVISYDMKPQILVDFTQDKRAVANALNMLRIPGFSETNLFDALYDTIDRIDGLEGRKYIVLISSGRDTFSRLTYDKILNKLKNTQNITIYAVGTGQAAIEYYDSRGMMGSIARLDYLQAQNQLNTFAKMTGGYAYFPRFQAEFPEIFREIGTDIRNQYTLAYHPSNTKLDGTYRKLKVELVGPDGSPLKVTDQHNKNVKYQVIAREGYKAKQVVE